MIPETTSFDNSKPVRRSALPILIPLMLFGIAGLLVIWYVVSPTPTPDAPLSPPVENFRGMQNTPFITSGIKNPLILKASEVDLRDDTVVIGIEVAGRFRAYKLDAFNSLKAHVVNDIVGKTPVSVTYCDRTDCIMVFTDSEGDKPLPIDVGGYVDELLLKVGDKFYFQKTGSSTRGSVTYDLPYTTHSFDRTTWKEWKTSHPMTEIYQGGFKR